MKKIIVFLSLLIFAGTTLFAQDDDLPPPSSNPNQTDEPREAPKAADPNDFKGFTKPKKFDMSKLLIEPIVNFSISQYRIDAGFAPSVAYRVFQPKNANPRWGNTGLFVGAGITYSYTQLNYGRGIKFNFQTYGGGPLIQYNIWRGLFVRAKLELLGRRIPLDNPRFVNNRYEFQYKQIFTPACLLGAGYNLLQSKNIFIPVIVSYNVLHSVVDREYSIYPRGFTVQLGFISVF